MVSIWASSRPNCMAWSTIGRRRSWLRRQRTSVFGCGLPRARYLARRTCRRLCKAAGPMRRPCHRGRYHAMQSMPRFGEETAAFDVDFRCSTLAWSSRLRSSGTIGLKKRGRRPGVEVVVTPGLRYAGRDDAGRPDRAGAKIYNGDTGAGNLIYVVRDDYFEPKLGHRAERGLEAVARKTRTGRPTLFETHRFNFVGEIGAARAAVDELGPHAASWSSSGFRMSCSCRRSSWPKASGSSTRN